MIGEKMEKTVVELFAGVGGFRVGLNEVIKDGNCYLEKDNYKFVWFNQWEPQNKAKQYAFDCYINNFKVESIDTYNNSDICNVPSSAIPKHALLVAGFPCQDYSVARTKSNEMGIHGKKGVLWWEIHRILKDKETPFFLLENVDRLLKSPSKQRGRDFGIMLRSLMDLGYAIEWKVINSADYCFPQKRKRVYIFGYKNTTKHYQERIKNADYFDSNFIFNKDFPINNTTTSKIKTNISDISNELYPDLVAVTENFKNTFYDTGIAIDGVIKSLQTYVQNPCIKPLKSVIQADVIDDSFYLDEFLLSKFESLRSGGKTKRISKNGFSYDYTQGKMKPYDDLDSPGRTMLTSEGSVNRSTHIIKDPTNGRIRFITPIEAEKMNGFPIDWTNTGMSNRKRYFMMGNALVCGIITKLGQTIAVYIDNE